MKEQKIKSIISAIKLNITKIHLFLLPYAILLSLFFIIVRLSNFLKFNYSEYLFGLIIIAYASVVKYYVSELVSEIERL